MTLSGLIDSRLFSADTKCIWDIDLSELFPTFRRNVESGRNLLGEIPSILQSRWGIKIEDVHVTYLHYEDKYTSLILGFNL